MPTITYLISIEEEELLESPIEIFKQNAWESPYTASKSELWNPEKQKIGES